MLTDFVGHVRTFTVSCNFGVDEESLFVHILSWVVFYIFIFKACVTYCTWVHLLECVLFSILCIFASARLIDQMKGNFNYHGAKF